MKARAMRVRARAGQGRLIAGRRTRVMQAVREARAHLDSLRRRASGAALNLIDTFDDLVMKPMLKGFA